MLIRTGAKYKKDFPALSGKSYLDNAATTQKPQAVIDAITHFYETDNANAHSGIYDSSENTAKLVNESRDAVAKLINADSDEIIFTRNATDSFNMLASSLKKFMGPGNNIVTTEIEHHSNFVPWQQLALEIGAEFRVAEYSEMNESINPEKYVDGRTKIVAISGMSNTTGLMPDVEKIIQVIRQKNKNTIIVLDITQLVAHENVDVKKLDCDFACFSAHKLYGPAGIGVLYGKKDMLEQLEPTRFGGGMIRKVTNKESSWADLPDRLEPGTVNAEGIIGTGAAIKYLNDNKLRELFESENVLKEYALKKLREVSGVKIIGHKKQKHGPVIAFTTGDMHPHDVATICARSNVCIRAGSHCAHPLHQRIGVPATLRISMSFYNDKKDVDKLIDALTDAKRILGGD
jgi:cysteine desulfurase / selenocysteine lyase